MKKRREHIDLTYESDAPKPLAPSSFAFRDVAVLPADGDNVAICTKRLERGTTIKLEKMGDVVLSHTVLEGHRFCVEPIGASKPLLSWGLPFGYATRDIVPGEYVCNWSVLEALRIRNLDFALPEDANFEDRITPHFIKEGTFRAGEPLPKYEVPATFKGFYRSERRGVGTRNFIVILGLTSTCGSYAKVLERELRGTVKMSEFPNIDGIVAVSHTEGATSSTPVNNLELLLRTLSGFVVHSNVGAVLVVDDSGPSSSPASPLNRGTLEEYLQKYQYPFSEVTSHFLSLSGDFKQDVSKGVECVTGWLGTVNKCERRDFPLSHLKIALQCGGSDAFSGISGNPLAAWAAKEVIQHGGAALLAETDELMGAESYIVKNARSLEVAQKFLDTIQRYKDWAGWHGHNAEGNPSGGNKFRGLYNIALKSLGAAMKKNPDVPLDFVVDYGERIVDGSGYYFMNSPGNDLESIAGQVATGCNLIYFITGNGSITNFPFVPTIKIVTTTGRFNMLRRDMDINAGEYLDGTPLPEVGRKLFDYTIGVASGTKSSGERAGHSQVSVWRNWALTGPSDTSDLQARPELHSGVGLAFKQKQDQSAKEIKFKALRTPDGKIVTQQLNLVLPTSLCSGQIARMIAEKLNSSALSAKHRFAALPHTEGCGASNGESEEIFRRTVIGHLINPVVKHGLLLEHGCEKTHNDYMEQYLKSVGVSPSKFGWASVQLDGGIDLVTEKVIQWFTSHYEGSDHQDVEMEVGLDHVKLGLLTPFNSKLSPQASKALAHLTQAIVYCGGTVVVPQNTGVAQSHMFLGEVIDETCPSVSPSVSYGQIPKSGGFHLMETYSDHWVENLTGLAACGVEAMVVFLEGDSCKLQQTHPLIPVIQVTTPDSAVASIKDVDLILGYDPEEWHKEILSLMVRVLSRDYTPKLAINSDFQIARGFLGISM